MHRNDWLPPAAVQISRGMEPDTLHVMCSQRIVVRKHFAAMTHSEQVHVRFNRGIEYEGAGVYLMKVPCAFVDGHPGTCGTHLPDIFLPDGRVKPQIERLLRNRRNSHGTVDPAPDRRPDHTSPT